MPTFLTPYLLWIKLGAAVLAVLAIFGAGMWLEGTIKDAVIAGMERDEAKAITAAVQKAAATQEAADKITHDVDVASAQAHQKIVTHTIHITQQVTRYVTTEDDKLFPLSCGFVRLHDAYASGADPAAVPIAAGKSDSARCDVTASYAATIIGANYGLALGWRADAQSWADWYIQQKANWDRQRASAKAVAQ